LVDSYFPWNEMGQNLQDPESPGCCGKVEGYLVAAPSNPKCGASAEGQRRVYVTDRPATDRPSEPPRCRVEASAFGLPFRLRCREGCQLIRDHIQADPLSKKRD